MEIDVIKGLHGVKLIFLLQRRKRVYIIKKPIGDKYVTIKEHVTSYNVNNT